MWLKVPAQSADKYDLKSITVFINDGDCTPDLSNPDSLVFCNWLCGLKECRDEFCWMTVYTPSNRIYQGVALHAIGPHNYWIKEITVYDYDWNVIDRHFDSLVNMNSLRKVGLYKSKKFLTETNRLSIISLIDGSIIQDSIGFKYRKPISKRDKLDTRLDCN